MVIFFFVIKQIFITKLVGAFTCKTVLFTSNTTKILNLSNRVCLTAMQIDLKEVVKPKERYTTTKWKYKK